MSDRPMVPADFQVGDHVVIEALGMRGRTGTISRAARLLWKKARLIELDDGDWRMRTTRVAETALHHVPPPRA